LQKGKKRCKKGPQTSSTQGESESISDTRPLSNKSPKKNL